MVTCSPTRMRSASSGMDPLLTVEQDVDGAVAPDKQVLAALAVSAVQATLADPLVDRLGADPEEGRQLNGIEDGRGFHPRRAGYLVFTQRSLARAHHRFPG